MDLNKTSDFNKAFSDYCTSVGLSCHGCEIRKFSPMPCSGHSKRSSCLEWALNNLDLAQSILQEYLDSKPFIPGFGDYYYHVIVSGNIEQTRFNESPFDYLCALAKNCFRTKDAACKHRDEIMAKFTLTEPDVGDIYRREPEYEQAMFCECVARLQGLIAAQGGDDNVQAR